MEHVKAAQAKGSIKKMLRGDGGSAQVRIGKTTRMLSHDSVIDRPLQRLPWPLSILQPHNVRYVVYEGEKMVEEKTFTKSQIDDAIRFFLNGLAPSTEVLILPAQDRF